MHHGFPVQINQSFCQLPTGCHCHNVGVVVNEVLPNARAKQFGVAIQTEATSVGPSISFE
jgi:hypothetical protein